jgi:hypothetical protein
MLVLAVQALRGVPVTQWDGVGLSALALVTLMSVTTAATTLLRREPAAAATV